MAKVILVRHGKTIWNAEGRYQGRVDVPLNEEGREQAKRVGLALRDFPIKAVYASPLKRCTDTAGEIAKYHKLNIITDEGLKEINHGKWEGMLATDVAKEYPELLKLWRERPKEVVMPEGESLMDVYRRAVPSFKRIIEKHPDDIVAIVGHDATNKVIMCYLLGLDLNMFWTFKQANCGITVVEINENGIIIHVSNATGHLGREIDFTVQKSL